MSKHLRQIITNIEKIFLKACSSNCSNLQAKRYLLEISKPLAIWWGISFCVFFFVSQRYCQPFSVGTGWYPAVCLEIRMFFLLIPKILHIVHIEWPIKPLHLFVFREIQPFSHVNSANHLIPILWPFSVLRLVKQKWTLVSMFGFVLS